MFTHWGGIWSTCPRPHPKSWPLPNLLPTFGLAAAIAACALPWAASAHDTWLAPRQGVVAPGRPLDLAMSSGDGFPHPGTAIAPERVELAACRQGGEPIALRTGARTTNSLALRAVPTTAKGLTCWVRLKPRKLDLALNKVDLYLDEIDAPVSVRDAWAAMPAPKKWLETYTKNAKLVVPGAEAGASNDPVGLALEFVPGVDLSTGRIIGADLPLTVLRDGRPLAGLSVGLEGGQGTRPQRQVSDAQGRLSFAAPTRGRWMITATDLRPVDPGRWESHFSTLVFDIKP